MLDLSVEISDNSILIKNGLDIDDQLEVSVEKLTEIIEDANQRYGQSKYYPGGSALNTSRILRTLGERRIIFCGSIGEDENGEILQNILKNDRLSTCLQTIEGKATGSCLCLIYGHHRCLVANIGAALDFNLEFLQSHQESFFKTQLFYIEGFFIPQKFDVCKFIYETYCLNDKSLLGINLSAPYICKNNVEEMKFLTEKCDIIFGNKNEFLALSTIYETTSIKETVKHLFSLYNKNDEKKMIIMTNSSESVTYHIGNSKDYKSDKYIVPLVDSENIVDTTGAGDSFVAGFLYFYFKNKTIKECVEKGCEVAGKVINQLGCVLPVQEAEKSLSICVILWFKI